MRQDMAHIHGIGDTARGASVRAHCAASGLVIVFRDGAALRDLLASGGAHRISCDDILPGSPGLPVLGDGQSCMQYITALFRQPQNVSSLAYSDVKLQFQAT